MHNWSVDESYIKKFPEKYKLWRLEQLISYGLGGERLDKKEVVANWNYLKTRLDGGRRKLLEYWLWKKRS